MDLEKMSREIAAARLFWVEIEGEVRSLRQQLAEDRAVCLCGCTPEQHENYGEDGEGCEREDHNCLRVAVAVRDLFHQAEAKAAGLAGYGAAADAEAASLRAAIRDIDAHATPVIPGGAEEPTHYLLTVGALHRALGSGNVSLTAPKCQAEQRLKDAEELLREAVTQLPASQLRLDIQVNLATVEPKP